MFGKTVTSILLPIFITMAVAAVGFHFYGTTAATKMATRELNASAHVVAEIIEHHVGNKKAVLRTVLGQEALNNYVMYAKAGLLDEAEDARLELERTLAQLAKGDSHLARIALYDASGKQVVGVFDGKRNLTPRNVCSETWFLQSLKQGGSTDFSLDGTIQVCQSKRDEESGELMALARIVYDFQPIGDDASTFANRHLDHSVITIIDAQDSNQFRSHDLRQHDDIVSGNAPLKSLEGRVVIEQVASVALAAFKHSEFVFFVALTILTVLLMIVASIGATYYTRELKNTAQNLRMVQASLQKQNETLESQNHRLESQKQDLVSARDAAQAATRSKSEFLANMSHEIRTPMTAILGFSEILLGNVSKPENVEGLKTIQRNGEYLLGILNDILDLSKIESGKLEIEQIECSPKQIITEVVTLMNVRAEAKSLKLEFAFDGAIPKTILSDPTRLRQILINLTGNAIKFTESGSVRLVARLIDDASSEPVLQFDVIDTGIGLSEKQIGMLFQPFVQADNSTTRNFGGTGLGLTISNRLAAMLGGEVSVQSSPGKGSTFSVTVPTGSLDNVQMIGNLAEGETPNKHKSETAIDNDRLNCRVLLAEDGPDNQRLISFILKKAGAEVTVVENGMNAVDAALNARDEGIPFDVILMDMQMPVLDGYEATAKLRENGYSRPIIALTAHAMASDRQKCLSAGCDEYTTKPINREKLIALANQYASQTTIVGRTN